MSFLADLRLSARSFGRAPGLALALVLTIAIGVGSNASIQGFIRGLTTRTVPRGGTDRLVSLFVRDARGAYGPLAYDEYQAINSRTDIFTRLGAARESQATVTIADVPVVMSTAEVTPELPALFGFSPGQSIAISHRLWQLDFGARDDVRGSLLRVDGVERRVGDVAPDWLTGLYLGRGVDIWRPLQASGQSLARGRTWWVVGQLQPGVAVERAEAAANAAVHGDAIVARPYVGMTPEVSAGMARVGGLLALASGAVFLVAGGSVTLLLLSRASARSRDTSIRVALGSSRKQLASQLLADGVVISLVGGGCGAVLALWTAQVIPALFFEADAEQLTFAPDVWRIAAVSVAGAALIAACALVPLLEAQRVHPSSALQRESAGPSRLMRRFRHAIVLAQLTCCCVLAISSILLLKGFRGAMQAGPGHRVDRTILATLEASAGFSRADRGLKYFDDAQLAVLALPGVQSAAWISSLPGSRPAWREVRVEPPHVPRREVAMDAVAFTTESLSTVADRAVVGRLFSGADTPQSCAVAVVNTAAADAVFGGDPLGRWIEDLDRRRVEIVGVVAPRARPGHAVTEPTVYYYAEQTPPPLGREGQSLFVVPEVPETGTAVLDAKIVSSGYFAAAGTAAIAGVTFDDLPSPGGCRVGVLNQEAAERYFGGQAVGGAVIDPDGRRTTIVGVVGSSSPRATGRASEPAIYLPMAQDYLPRMTLSIAASAADEAMVGAVRKRLAEVNGGASTAVVATLSAHLGRTALAPERIATTLVTVLAVLALSVGVIGVHGALAESARQRRRDVALRVAFGARGWTLVGQLVWEGAQLAAAGTVAGGVGSVVVARWLARVAPDAGWPTAPMYAIGALILAGVVALATVIPARRVLTLDPLPLLTDRGRSTT